VLAAVVMAVVLGLLGVLASTALRDGPARAATPPHPEPSTSSAARVPTTPADPRADRRAPVDRGAHLLEVLADARASAYREADPAQLVGAEVREGALWSRDRAAVAQLRAGGLRYDGLRYVVNGVTTLEAGPRTAVLRARVGTGAYRVVGSGPAAAHPADPGEVVLVDLALTTDGWRVAEIRAVA